jgi:hypothetical protein
MPTEFILPLGILIALIAWSLVMYWYVHPILKQLPVERAIEPILLLHTFRYVGLMFLIPGVTTEVLDTRFSSPAAYGDLIAAILAFVAIGAIRLKLNFAMLSVWLFNIWGMADLLNAVTRGILYTNDGHLGATYWIPATIVPLLLVTHAYVFILLIKQMKRGRRISYH